MEEGPDSTSEYAIQVHTVIAFVCVFVLVRTVVEITL